MMSQDVWKVHMLCMCTRLVRSGQDKTPHPEIVSASDKLTTINRSYTAVMRALFPSCCYFFCVISAACFWTFTFTTYPLGIWLEDVGQNARIRWLCHERPMMKKNMKSKPKLEGPLPNECPSIYLIISSPAFELITTYISRIALVKKLRNELKIYICIYIIFPPLSTRSCITIKTPPSSSIDIAWLLRRFQRWLT